MESLSPRFVRALFVRHLETYGKSWVSDISKYYDGDMAQEDFPFLGDVPRLSKSTGTPNISDLMQETIRIVMEDLDCGLRIKPKAYRRDKTGSIESRMMEISEAASDQWIEAHSTLINNGQVGLAFDGIAYFATSHAWHDSGAWSNLITFNINDIPVAAAEMGTVALPSTVAMTYAIFEGIKAILKAKSDKGHYINKQAKIFQVQGPLDYALQLKSAIANLNIGKGFTNELLNASAGSEGFKLELVVNPELTDVDAIQVFRTDSNRKPFVHQEEVSPETTFLGPGSEHAAKNPFYLLILKASRAVAYGDHRLAAKVLITKT